MWQKRCRAQSLVEYSVALAVMVVVSVAALKVLGKNIQGTLSIPTQNTPISLLGAIPSPSGGPASTGSGSSASNGSGTGSSANGSSGSTLNENSSAPVLVSGAIGASGRIQANTDRLLQIAETLGPDSELGNLIVQLGQKGIELAPYANGLSKGTQQPAARGLNAYDSLRNTVLASAEYARLSPEDQQIVSGLSGQNIQLLRTAPYSETGDWSNAPARMVYGNSEQVIVCGENGTCDPGA